MPLICEDNCVADDSNNQNFIDFNKLLILVFRSQNTDEELKKLSKTTNPEEIDIGEEDDEEETIEGERKVECVAFSIHFQALAIGKSGIRITCYCCHGDGSF